MQQRRVIVGLAVGLILAGSVADASDIRTYPTRLTLTPDASIGSIMIRNDDSVRTVIQVEARSWSQSGGEDRYEATRDLLVNPVIFEIQPGSEQVVRVGLQAGQVKDERSYRLFLQEIPAKDAPQQKGITTLLRIGIPVFVPPLQADHLLSWAARLTEGGKLAVTLANRGSAHIQVTGLTVQNANGTSLIKGNVFGYVLPGQSHQWEFALTGPVRPNEQVTLEATTDYQNLTSQLVIGVPDGVAAH